MPKGKLKKADESLVAGAIRRAIGASDNEDVDVTTPQFERPPGWSPPAPPPQDRADWDSLGSLPKDKLRALGFQPWGREEDAQGKEYGPALWLFPGEWYNHIPDGLPIVNINFQTEAFRRGESDDDIRYGCLPYGVLGATLEDS